VKSAATASTLTLEPGSMSATVEKIEPPSLSEISRPTAARAGRAPGWTRRWGRRSCRRRDVGDALVLRRVQAQRVDRGRADRDQIVARSDVVGREVDDVLELVEVELARRQGRVRLVVGVEVHDLDVDPFGSRGILVGLPVRVARADDTDADGVLRAAGALARGRRRTRRRSAEGEGNGQDRGQGLRDMVVLLVDRAPRRAGSLGCPRSPRRGA
jgi:hypothetical protein